MTKKRTGLFDALRRMAVTLLVAVFAVLSLPFSLLGASKAAGASAESATTDNSEQHVAAPTADEDESEEAATVSVELTVNYYRRDQNYEGWNMWVWENGGKGENYWNNNDTKRLEFDSETIEFPGYEGKKWATLTVTVKNVDLTADFAIGCIVRKGDWEQKTADMHIYADEIVDNAVTIYLTETDSSIYTSAEEVMANKINEASFESFNNVKFVTSGAITNASLFKVKDNDGTVVGTLDMSVATNMALVEEEIDEDEKKTGRYIVHIKLDNDMSLSKTYEVVDEPAGGFNNDVNFVKRAVSTSPLFDTEAFSDKYGYTGTLGAEYSATETKFTVWSPAATAMTLNIYENGEGGTPETYTMTAGEKGTWTYTLAGNQKNKYYTYSVGVGSRTTEVVDPYARSGGRNGKRGMIVDLKSTNPDGWDTQKNPTLASNTQAVIYEAHLRDLTIHEHSGVTAANRGKFLGLTETGTKNSYGEATALDYLKEIGVTEVHFQPLFDFASVQETFNQATYQTRDDVDEEHPIQFNWGYDPLNYNMPEGSYSSNPADGYTRVNEMKQMIMALHNAGIQVVMDVVYNHVSDAGSSNFEALMPGYYFRTNADGSLSNGSGCGNETASERAMFRKFMIDSVIYWTEEYKIDGFRFDLMGLHDVDTMNKLYEELAKINPDVIVYGEGWTGGSSPLPSEQAATLANSAKVPNIAFFNDEIRDGLKGGVFADDGKLSSKGFVSGIKNEQKAIYNSAKGGSQFENPTQSINYVACHDNSLLWDRLNTSVGASQAILKSMYRMAAVGVFTSQGIAFMPAGEEMLRSKPTSGTYNAKNDTWSDSVFDSRPYYWFVNPQYTFSDNSYRSPDSTNAIDWDLRHENADMVNYYKALIQIKRTFPQFSLETKEQIEECVFICDAKANDGIAFYAVKDPDSNSYAVVMFNNTITASEVIVPDGTYSVYVNGAQATADKENPLSTFTGDKYDLPSRTAVVMVGELTEKSVVAWQRTVNPDKYPTPAPEKNNNDDDSNLGLALGLGIGIPAAVLIAGGVVFGVMYGKKKKGKGQKTESDEPKAADEPPAEESTDAPAEEPAAEQMEPEAPADDTAE